MEDKDVVDIPDISDKAFQVSTINTNLIIPREFVKVETDSIVDKEKVFYQTHKSFTYRKNKVRIKTL